MTKTNYNKIRSYIHGANLYLDWTLKLLEPENDPKNFTVDTPEGEYTEAQLEVTGS